MRMFDSSVYTTRREELAKKIEQGVIVIMGNEDAPINYTGNVYQYRQNSNFLYYFGIQHPNLNAVINIDKNEVIIYGHENTIDDIIWVGDVEPLSELARKVGVTIVKSENDFVSDVKQLNASKAAIHYLPPYRHEHFRILNEVFGYDIDAAKENASVSLIYAVSSQRSIKTALEVSEIAKSVEITKAMHLVAMQQSAPNKYEHEVVGEILKACKSGNGSLAYGVIFSINGQVLHNHEHHNKMIDGRMVINDSGAENDMCYAADITRSFPVNGTFTTKQKDIYNIVLEMEKTSIASLAPGVSYRDTHINANKILITRFKELGLLQGDTEAMLEQGVGGLFMPHGLGHQMGLDVHDMEDLGEKYIGYDKDQERSTQLGLKSLRLAKKLEAGNVLTVEPGIYFVPQLIEKFKAENKFTEFVNYEALQSYYDFGGIRVEDNILITPSGHEVIGSYISKEVDEVEAICKG